MATEKQIEANRRNAQKSCGPITDEGKAQSRRNALDHGLTSKMLLPKDLEGKKELRLADWRGVLAPQDSILEFELDLAVTASLKIEHSQSCETIRRIELAEIAADPSDTWDQDRRAEAARLGRSLKRDPVGVSLQLRRTPAGREWLLGEWRQLLKGAREFAQCYWDKDESNHALDLLGTPSTVRPPIVSFQCQIEPPEMHRTTILKEIAALEALQANAGAENDKLRQEHILGLITNSDAKLKLIRRYEASALREFRKSITILRQSKAPVSKPTQAASTPQSKCETNPIPVVVTPPIVVAPTVAAAPEVKKEPTGNRLYRRERQKAERHEAYLARKAS